MKIIRNLILNHFYIILNIFFHLSKKICLSHAFWNLKINQHIFYRLSIDMFQILKFHFI